jgi:general secretion pathway protein D
VGSRDVTSFDYNDVGMTLRARPNITPENKVDMNINLIISQLTSQLVNNQPVRSRMNTTTTAIVDDGETIMLGGILFQEDSKVERKVPFFGDIPLLGGFFRHNEAQATNNELIVFLTPYVIDEPSRTKPGTTEEMEKANEKLEKILKELQVTLQEKIGDPN